MIGLNETEDVNISFSEDNLIDIKIQDIDNISEYKEAEQIRRNNENIRINNEQIREDYYNQFKQDVANNKFKGDTGATNTIDIGTVESGTIAKATMTGVSPNQTLNLVLPRGEKGEKGDTNSYYAGNNINIDENNTINAIVPTKISQLINDSGFINRNSLANNYYTKSETYSQNEVNNLVSKIPKFDIQVVDTLPTNNISSTTVYLVPSGTKSKNIYTEYIYINNDWEELGTQSDGLSDYYSKSEVDTKIDEINDKFIFDTTIIEVEEE